MLDPIKSRRISRGWPSLFRRFERGCPIRPGFWEGRGFGPRKLRLIAVFAELDKSIPNVMLVRELASKDIDDGEAMQCISIPAYRYRPVAIVTSLNEGHFQVSFHQKDRPYPCFY